MPNWCTNHLRVTGSKDDILELFTIAGAGNSILTDAITVSHVVLPGSEAQLTQAIVRNADTTGVFSFNGHVPEPELEGEGWYEWRNKNWGTKWDVNDVFVVDVSCSVAGVWSVTIQFDTAWCPPYEWLAKLCSHHPQVDIRLIWNEEQGLLGAFRSVDGSLAEEEITFEQAESEGFSCVYAPYDELFDELEEDTSATAVV
jgi:hypothetical protein